MIYPTGLLIYYIIIALCHCVFGIVSTEHKFKKPVVYISYAVFFAIFVGLSFIKMKYYMFALIIFAIYILFYLVLSKGRLISNLFLMLSYMIFVLIYFGITYAYVLIDCPGAIIIRWVLLLITLGLILALLYGYLIPQFRKAEPLIQKGWSLLIIGDILFLGLIFMQIFYPYQLNTEDVWMIVIFIFTSLIYFVVFSIIFRSFATTHSFYEEKRKNDELEVLAHVDMLTQLRNRASFEMLADDFNDEKIREGSFNIAVLVIDINKFKEINDLYGHMKGDEVLQNVSKLLLEVFDIENYHTFRVGGDEFAIVSIEVSEEELKERISYLHKELKERLDVSVAVGYSYVNSKDIDAIRTAFKNADKIMYQHKFR